MLLRGTQIRKLNDKYEWYATTNSEENYKYDYALLVSSGFTATSLIMDEVLHSLNIVDSINKQIKDIILDNDAHTKESYYPMYHPIRQSTYNPTLVRVDVEFNHSITTNYFVKRKRVSRLPLRDFLGYKQTDSSDHRIFLEPYNLVLTTPVLYCYHKQIMEHLKDSKIGNVLWPTVESSIDLRAYTKEVDQIAASLCKMNYSELSDEDKFRYNTSVSYKNRWEKVKNWFHDNKMEIIITNGKEYKVLDSIAKYTDYLTYLFHKGVFQSRIALSSLWEESTRQLKIINPLYISNKTTLLSNSDYLQGDAFEEDNLLCTYAKKIVATDKPEEMLPKEDLLKKPFKVKLLLQVGSSTAINLEHQSNGYRRQYLVVNTDEAYNQIVGLMNKNNKYVVSKEQMSLKQKTIVDIVGKDEKLKHYLLQEMNLDNIKFKCTKDKIILNKELIIKYLNSLVILSYADIMMEAMAKTSNNAITLISSLNGLGVVLEQKCFSDNRRYKLSVITNGVRLGSLYGTRDYYVKARENIMSCLMMSQSIKVNSNLFIITEYYALHPRTDIGMMLSMLQFSDEKPLIRMYEFFSDKFKGLKKLDDITIARLVLYETRVNSKMTLFSHKAFTPPQESSNNLIRCAEKLNDHPYNLQTMNSNDIKNLNVILNNFDNLIDKYTDQELLQMLVTNIPKIEYNIRNVTLSKILNTKSGDVSYAVKQTDDDGKEYNVIHQASVESWQSSLDYILNSSKARTLDELLEYLLKDVNSEIWCHLFWKQSPESNREITVLNAVGKLLCAYIEYISQSISACSKYDMMVREKMKTSTMISGLKKHRYSITIDHKAWCNYVRYEMLNKFGQKLFRSIMGNDNYAGKILDVCLFKLQHRTLVSSSLISNSLKGNALQVFEDSPNAIWPHLIGLIKYNLLTTEEKAILLNVGLLDEEGKLNKGLERLNNICSIISGEHAWPQGILSCLSSLFGNFLYITILNDLKEMKVISDYDFLQTSDDVVILFNKEIQVPNAIILKLIENKLSKYGLKLSTFKCSCVDSCVTEFNSNYYDKTLVENPEKIKSPFRIMKSMTSFDLEDPGPKVMSQLNGILSKDKSLTNHNMVINMKNFLEYYYKIKKWCYLGRFVYFDYYFNLTKSNPCFELDGSCITSDPVSYISNLISNSPGLLSLSKENYIHVNSFSTTDKTRLISAKRILYENVSLLTQQYKDKSLDDDTYLTLLMQQVMYCSYVKPSPRRVNPNKYLFIANNSARIEVMNHLVSVPWLLKNISITRLSLDMRIIQMLGKKKKLKDTYSVYIQPTNIGSQVNINKCKTIMGLASLRSELSVDKKLAMILSYSYGHEKNERLILKTRTYQRFTYGVDCCAGLCYLPFKGMSVCRYMSENNNSPVLWLVEQEVVVLSVGLYAIADPFSDSMLLFLVKGIYTVNAWRISRLSVNRLIIPKKGPDLVTNGEFKEDDDEKSSIEFIKNLRFRSYGKDDRLHWMANGKHYYSETLGKYVLDQPMVTIAPNSRVDNTFIDPHIIRPNTMKSADYDELIPVDLMETNLAAQYFASFQTSF